MSRQITGQEATKACYLRRASCLMNVKDAGAVRRCGLGQERACERGDPILTVALDASYKNLTVYGWRDLPRPRHYTPLVSSSRHL